MNPSINPVSTRSMLSVFDTIEVRNEQKISAADLEFCQNQQTSLYRTLEQIERWYDIFRIETEQYAESHKLVFKPNGSVTTNRGYISSQELEKDYGRFYFLPFESLNALVEQHFKAINHFAYEINGYFNKTYNLSVPTPDIDKEKTPFRSRPEYMTYVDRVITHLGGKGFRQVAEEEVIQRFKKVVTPHWQNKVPELIGDKIAFQNIFRFDEFWLKNGQTQISYNYHKEIDIFCEGVALGAGDMLGGNSKIILDFDDNNVNISEPYQLGISTTAEMKFYKNGRIDLRFDNKEQARAFYNKMRLDQVINPNLK